MSAIANLVAFDGAATPVSHTFLPLGITNNGEIEASYMESIAGVPLFACPTVKLGRSVRQKSGVYRSVVTVEVPVMEAILNQNASGYTAAPKVAYTDKIAIVQYAHERSTPASRKLVRQLAINIAGNITTSVTPVNTGPVPELFDLAVAPT